jgi:sugar lactone lactonase YvrE
MVTASSIVAGFKRMRETERGITDGLRVDTKGNLYETGPGGVWVISPDGKHLGTIRAPEQSTNVGFGDADRKTLYIAARTSIYSRVFETRVVYGRWQNAGQEPQRAQEIKRRT